MAPRSREGRSGRPDRPRAALRAVARPARAARWSTGRRVLAAFRPSPRPCAGPARGGGGGLRPAPAPGDRAAAPPRCQQQGVQQVLINGRSPRPQVSPPRLVPLVDIARRELKDQLGGKRRGDLALPGDDPHRPRADRLEQPAQARQLQVLIEAFAKGLDDDREIGKLAHDLEQVLRPQPLQPERGPLGGIRPGHESAPGPRSGGIAARKARPPAAPGGSIAPPRRRSDHRANPEAGHPFRAAGSRAHRRHAGTRPGCHSARGCGPAVRVSTPGASCRRTGKGLPGRASPAGSRKVSTRIVRSSGTTPATRAWRAIWRIKGRVARASSRHCSSSQRGSSGSSSRPAISRQSAPTAAPSSAERGESSPLQNGMTAVFPSAGPTTTRWASMASILQVLFPSAKASPTRRSKTNSSSSSPSRGPSAPRNTGNCPVSGIVPPPTRANRAEPGRAARRL